MKTTASTIIIAAMAFTVATSSSTIVFSDATFADGDWTASKIFDNTAGQSATFSSGQIATGGNPGAFREVIHDYGIGNIGVGHVGTKLIFTPATQGAITSIAFSYDVRAFSIGVSGAIGYWPLVFQNGSFYIPNIEDFAISNQWVSFSHAGLPASDFSLLGGSSHPDFSTNGSSIEFGFYTSNGTAFGTGHTDSGIDNYSASIVPEPSAIALILWGTMLCFGRPTLRLHERNR